MEISWLQAPCCICHWPQWPGSAGPLLLVHRRNSVSVLELLRGEGTHLVMAVCSKQQKKSRCLFTGMFECLFHSKQKVTTRQVFSSGLLNDSQFHGCSFRLGFSSCVQEHYCFAWIEICIKYSHQSFISPG